MKNDTRNRLFENTIKHVCEFTKIKLPCIKQYYNIKNYIAKCEWNKLTNYSKNNIVQIAIHEVGTYK